MLGGNDLPRSKTPYLNVATPYLNVATPYLNIALGYRMDLAMHWRKQLKSESCFLKEVICFQVWKAKAIEL